MAEQLNNLCAAYQVLENRVRRALNTQVGDAKRLMEQRRHVFLYVEAAEQVSQDSILTSKALTKHSQHRALFSAEEFLLCKRAPRT